MHHSLLLLNDEAVLLLCSSIKRVREYHFKEVCLAIIVTPRPFRNYFKNETVFQG